MSDNKIQNEEELWSVLDGTAPAAPKTEAKPQKSEAKFAKPGAPKGKVDGFFLTCMAGVAAVSVAATLVISGMTGGERSAADPAATTAPAAGISASELMQENAELQRQVELQKQQIQDLRAQVLDLTDTVQSGETDASAEAYEIFRQIQAAYDDFDREALEELIPQMNERLDYLSDDALLEYYHIMEYVEQPSNG